MTRTKALLVVGCIMLALAVLAALELKQETTEPAGQVVTGLISKTTPPDQIFVDAPKPGALVPLDQGTLRPDESQPKTRPDQAEEAALKPTESTPTRLAQAIPVQADPEPVKPEPVRPEPVKPEPVQPEPVKPEPILTEPVAPEQPKKELPKVEQAKPEQTKPELPKVEQEKPAQAKPEQAKPEPVKSEQAKPEQAKPAQAKSEQAKPEPVKSDVQSDTPSRQDKAVRAIDTAGPIKVEKNQKAIVWTRLELADKSAVFRLSGAEKVEGKAFGLPNPDRYVVDLQGDWAMRLPAVPRNAFIKQIRVGKNGDNTRLVLDLSGARTGQMVRINPTTLEFRIK